MKNHTDNQEYVSLVHDILDNKEFQKLQNIVHHGHNRLDHSLRVSYFSYKIGKVLTLDYRKIARAALLHDFFFEENEGASYSSRVKTLIHHPEYALENATKYYDLTEMEKDIIVSHMFPISLRLPRFLESWLVDLVDDCVSVGEKVYMARREFSTAMSFVFFCLINYLR